MNIFSNVSCCIFRCRVPCWIILSRLLCSLGNRQEWQGWKTRSRLWLSGGLGWWFGIPGMPRNDFFFKAPCIPWLIYSTLHPKNLHKGTQSPVHRPLFPIFSNPFLPLSWRPKAVPGQNWCYQRRPTPAQWVKSWKYHMDPQTAGRLTTIYSWGLVILAHTAKSQSSYLGKPIFSFYCLLREASWLKGANLMKHLTSQHLKPSF